MFAQYAIFNEEPLEPPPLNKDGSSVKLPPLTPDAVEDERSLADDIEPEAEKPSLVETLLEAKFKVKPPQFLRCPLLPSKGYPLNLVTMQHSGEAGYRNAAHRMYSSDADVRNGSQRIHSGEAGFRNAPEQRVHSGGSGVGLRSASQRRSAGRRDNVKPLSGLMLKERTRSSMKTPQIPQHTTRLCRRSSRGEFSPTCCQTDVLARHDAERQKMRTPHRIPSGLSGFRDVASEAREEVGLDEGVRNKQCIHTELKVWPYWGELRRTEAVVNNPLPTWETISDERRVLDLTREKHENPDGMDYWAMDSVFLRHKKSPHRLAHSIPAIECSYRPITFNRLQTDGVNL